MQPTIYQEYNKSNFKVWYGLKETQWTGVLTALLLLKLPTKLTKINVAIIKLSTLLVLNTS